MNNIFSIEKNLDFTKESFFQLFKNENCLVEKIVSAGQSTGKGEWLEGDREEFVILLQGESELKFLNGEILKMKAGDYLLIPRNTKHRVNYTSSEPKCIWLAIHIK